MSKMQKLASWPWLKCKGFAATCVSEWLYDIHNRIPHPTPRQEDRKLTLFGFVTLFDCCRAGNFELTAEQLSSMRIAHRAALCGYHKLSLDSSLLGRPHFAMKPKFHVNATILLMHSCLAGICSLERDPLALRKRRERAPSAPRDPSVSRGCWQLPPPPHVFVFPEGCFCTCVC